LEGRILLAADLAGVAQTTALIDSAVSANQATVQVLNQDVLQLAADLAPLAVNDAYTVKKGGVLSEIASLVKDINPGGGNASFPTSGSQLVNVNGTLYFVANKSGVGWELWKSNGTAAGTVLVKDIVAGSGSSNPAQLTNVNGTLFFTAETATNGRELWKSNGTAAGTVLVKDIRPGSGYGFYFGLTDTLVNMNGTLFFTANNGVNGVELWKSNGTAAGTVMVKDIRPGALSSSPALLTNVNGTLFFVANDGVTGPELWKSNGTAAGTQLVKNINPSGGFHITELKAVNGTLFFTAIDSTNGLELWKSNGTATGTMLVKNINTATFASSNPTNLTNVNGTLFFTANNGVNGVELWKSNGTAVGTVLVKDITPGVNGTSFTNLTSVGSKLFFRGPGTGASLALWVSNGTSAGTVKLAPNGLALPGLANGSPMITDVNGVAYFRSGANDLWKSDGIVAGTVLILAGARPQGLTNVNGTLFFSGYQVSTGQELMKVSKANVLANDRDPEGKPLTAVRVSGPTKGTLTLNANGTFTYRPNAGFVGTDSFTYRASDGALQSNLATVTITVTA
jgi:ELWxxDGT repeat protein